MSATVMRALVISLVLTPLLCGACATSEPKADLTPGERPAGGSTEAGLWMKMDKVEEKVRTSGKVETDPKLNAYVRNIVCRLSAEYCPYIRVYVINQANFNATMAPNGAMSVWTGLILRTQNEAQLATILGHELAHYQRRHSLQRWEAMRENLTTERFVRLAIFGAAGLGTGNPGAMAGFVGNSAVYTITYAFTRDQEREADKLGLEMMVEAGHDPAEAAKIWQLLLEERDASEEPRRLLMFSTHPSTEERGKTLAKEAAAISGHPRFAGRDRFLSVTAPFRGQWLRDELRWRDYSRLEVLLDQKLAEGVDPGLVRFYRGEVYRRRAEDGDKERALAEYEAALAERDAPPETYRSLGLTYWSLRRADQARESFEAYLREQPNAEDRPMVEAYLRQIK